MLSAATPQARSASIPSFDELYQNHFEFVWRSLRRMGVAEGSVDDAAHDVFLVVHRRLRDFEGRSSARTWLFGIAWRVASLYRMRESRRATREVGHEEAPDSARHRPDAEAMRRESAELVQRVLDRLTPERRAVLIAVEIEQLTVPEVAEALLVPLNTAYSRLRLARRDFEQVLRGIEARRTVRYP